MTTKIWARLDAAVSTTHPTGTVMEVTIPLDATLIPGKDIFSPKMTFVDVTTISGIAVGWTTTDGVTFTAPAPVLPSVVRLTAYATAKQQSVLKAGQTFNVAAAGSPAMDVLCDGTQSTRADLAMLALYGQINPNGSKTWLDNNGLSTILSGTELVTLTTLAGDWITDTYASLAQLLGAIAAPTPKVTTYAQIDAFVWPTS